MPELAWASRTAVVLAVAGVFGTWRSSGSVSLDGFEGPHNGWLVIVFAAIGLAGIGAASRGSWLGIVLILGCAAVMMYAAVTSLADDGPILGGSAGWGVWLTLVASAGLALAAVAAAARRRSRGSTPADPRTSS